MGNSSEIIDYET